MQTGYLLVQQNRSTICIGYPAKHHLGISTKRLTQIAQYTAVSIKTCAIIAKADRRAGCIVHAPVSIAWCATCCVHVVLRFHCSEDAIDSRNPWFLAAAQQVVDLIDARSHVPAHPGQTSRCHKPLGLFLAQRL